jgi:hypothetical protein
MALYQIIRPVYLLSVIEASSEEEAESKEFEIWCEAGGENLPFVTAKDLEEGYRLHGGEVLLMTGGDYSGESIEGIRQIAGAGVICLE